MTPRPPLTIRRAIGEVSSGSETLARDRRQTGRSIVMTDAEFFVRIVVPTVEEFARNPGDVRRGVLACIVLQSMADHYVANRLVDPGMSKAQKRRRLEKFNEDLREKDKAFAKVGDVANGTKHARQEFVDLHLERPAVCGIMRCGFPLSSRPYVFMDEDNAWLLCLLTGHVAEMWQMMLGSPLPNDAGLPAGAPAYPPVG